MPALAALKEAVECASATRTKEKRIETRAWVPESSGRAIGGVLGFHRRGHRPSCITSGEPHCWSRTLPAISMRWEKLRAAIDTGGHQLHDVYDSMSSASAKTKAAIFKAPEAFLNDAELAGEATGAIEGRPRRRLSWHRRLASASPKCSRSATSPRRPRADLHDGRQPFSPPRRD